MAKASFDAAARALPGTSPFVSLDVARPISRLYGMGDLESSRRFALRPDGEPSAVGALLQTSGVPIYRGFAIYQVETRRGARGVSGAIVCPLDRRGQPRPQAGLHFACDGIAVSVGWAPDAGLLYQGAARFGYSKAVEQFVPRSLPPGLFAAGRVNGVFSWPQRCADGHRAALPRGLVSLS